jgi:hypothetical protein
VATVTANLGAQRPLRLVGGRWRRWAARGRVTITVAPLLLIAVMIGGSAFACGVATVPLALACLLVSPAWLHARARSVWWRLRWPWDARAGGLARVAEHGVETDHDFRPEGAMEAVPVLARVDVTAYGRRYVIRPLPGMSTFDLEQSIPLLTVRWCASQVTIRPDARRGRFVLDVVPGAHVDKPTAVPADVLPGSWPS